MAEDATPTTNESLDATPAAAEVVSAPPETSSPEPDLPADEAPDALEPVPGLALPLEPQKPSFDPDAEEPPDFEAMEAALAAAEAAANPPPEPLPNLKKWYVVKVQSNREDTIKEAIERRMRKEGLEEYYGQIVIPVEKYTEMKQDKNGRKVTRTKERKLYPGYLFCEVEYNDRILYLFRETSGVGDFVGSHPNKPDRAPTPMTPTEVLRMVGPTASPDGETAAPALGRPKWMQCGERVRVADGAFVGMEGIVKQLLEATNKVQVEVTIFGRPVGVELDYYQVEEI